MASDDDLAQLQKLSNEYQPEATVSAAAPAPHRRAAVMLLLLTARRARSSGQDNPRPPSPPSTQTATPSIVRKPRFVVCSPCPPSAPTLNSCQNLPYKYSHYRTCRGDGHCGWRGMHCTLEADTPSLT